MEKQYNHYDYLRWELFEKLIPSMLYKGTEEQKEEFFQSLIHDGKNVIHSLYDIICEEDKLPYPYEKEDFEVNVFERGGINFLQILFPSYNPNINDILRTYLLFSKLADGSYMIRYFVIKRFRSGNVFNIYVTPEEENLLGEELTDHVGDMEYEYWKLARDYSKIVLQDIMLDKKPEKKESDKSNKKDNKSDTGKWSMDWKNFNWELVFEKIEIAENELKRRGEDKKLFDIGITEEQFEEYLQWLYENNPEEYRKLMLYKILKEEGVKKQDIEFCLARPEKLE